jgi:hypothetical protein
MTKTIVSMAIHRKGEILICDKGCIVHRIPIKKGMDVEIKEGSRTIPKEKVS